MNKQLVDKMITNNFDEGIKVVTNTKRTNEKSERVFAQNTGETAKTFPSELRSRWTMAVMSKPEWDLKAAVWCCKCLRKECKTIREKGAK